MLQASPSRRVKQAQIPRQPICSTIQQTWISLRAVVGKLATHYDTLGRNFPSSSPGLCLTTVRLSDKRVVDVSVRVEKNYINPNGVAQPRVPLMACSAMNPSIGVYTSYVLKALNPLNRCRNKYTQALLGKPAVAPGVHFAQVTRQRGKATL